VTGAPKKKKTKKKKQFFWPYGWLMKKNKNSSFAHLRGYCILGIFISPNGVSPYLIALLH
jgi:hypothetical protein